MRTRSMAAILVGVTVAVGLSGASCRPREQLTCRVNEVCFVCPSAKEQTKCLRDPATSRCKWAEPSRCK